MITKLNDHNLDAVSKLALKLWPDAEPNELKENFKAMLISQTDICLVYSQANTPIGFIHASTRSDYVEGTENSPVGYIEGLYIEADYRGSGYSRELVAEVEKWAKEKGFKQLASDCELKNDASIAFHKKIAFQEVNRIVCFVKDLT